MTSIRHLLRRRLVAGLALLFAVLCGGLYLLTRHLLVAQFDATLEAKVRVLSTMVKRVSGEMEVDFDEEPMPEFERERAPEYFELRGPGGNLLVGSGSLRGGRRLGVAPGGGDLVAQSLPLPDGRPGRAISLRFTPAVEGDRSAGGAVPRFTLVIARDRSELDGALVRVSAALGATALLLLVGAALIVGRVVERGLRPLGELAERAGRIDATTLDTRFPESGLPTELQAISRRLNDLLGRLQSSFERERRFSADVAHELRTPIAELRALAEVALAARPAAAEGGETLRETLDIAIQMGRVVGNLLALARCAADRQEIASETLDLAEAAREAWRPFPAAAEARKLRASFDLAPATVDSDRALLAAIATNLFSNAVEHTPPDGEIACTVRPYPDGAALEVTNTCTGLDTGDLAHVFEPFWRKDAARTDGTHSGLGLALVAAYARLLGADLRADLPDGRRFRIRLTLAAPRAAGRTIPSAG